MYQNLINIDRIEMAVFVLGLVESGRRFKSGAYEAFVGEHTFQIPKASELHLNRGAPSTKRMFQFKCDLNSNAFFQAIRVSLSSDNCALRLTSDELTEDIVIQVVSVRKEMRIFGDKAINLTGSHEGKLIVNGSSIGPVKVYLPDTTADKFEAILTDAATETENRFVEAAYSKELCQLDLEDKYEGN